MNNQLLKFRLPQIEKVILQNFSLYSANPNAEFECKNGVICLVGANGIGKSTLLSAINFCLTGIVPEPNRPFKSMEEYYNSCQDFSKTYFRGRIEGRDEDEAQIKVIFNVGEVKYESSRNLFEPDSLRTLTITDNHDQRSIVTTEDMTRRERHAVYVSQLVSDTRLSSFEEFAFLQHFVLTFDEQRRTLFWNQRVLERALYLAFGLEPDMAKRFDSLARERESADSQVRNRKWEATRALKRINEIQAVTQAVPEAKETFDELNVDHETLTLQFAEKAQALQKAEDALRDANLRLAEVAVHETALRDEYDQFFNQSFELRPSPSQHPLILQSIENHTCGLCGNQEDVAITNLEAKSRSMICPICDSNITDQSTVMEDNGRLQEVDKQLSVTKKDLKNALSILQKVKDEESRSRDQYNAAKKQLDEFERQNGTKLDALRLLLSNQDQDLSLKVIQDQLLALEKEKDEAYQKRERIDEEISKLQKSVEEQYFQVEELFVPKFAELAKRFLGMPLSIKWDNRQSNGLNLIVTVRGNPRRNQEQLSESQRFFLDIALRMALTSHMSDPSAKGGMFIDTPEGSLDIAYEKRAGDMLAMFAEDGHQILMTANLNSSQLLLALAHSCGHEKMQLIRMTDWAELSSVQREEEDLFNTAYSVIDRAMEEKTTWRD